MAIEIFEADSLGQYYETVCKIQQQIASNEKQEQIKCEYEGEGKIELLWFRAESRTAYSLLPSLFRNNVSNGGIRISDIGQYTSLHYNEDIRTQHYHAKNYHYFEQEPSSRIEWLEVMQHHGVKTRLLDWSESSTHSLLFALEPYYRTGIDLHYCRYDLSPCVWVLNPRAMNRELLIELGSQKALQRKLLEELSLNSDEMERLLDRIETIINSFQERDRLGRTETYHIEYIYNLSEICDEILRDRSRIKNMLLQGEPFNPVFYLLARINSDGYLLENLALPPLAVVQPYHSERIKAQKGVFTVFPFGKIPNSKIDMNALADLGINLSAMSYNQIVRKHLFKIILTKPQKIACELLKNGISDSWLYPEMPIVSNEIEARKVY